MEISTRFLIVGGLLTLALLIAIISSVSADRPQLVTPPAAHTAGATANSGGAG